MQSVQLLLRPVISLRALFCTWLETIAKPVYLRIAKRNKPAWGHSMDSLGRFQEGTLGKDMYYFLQHHALHLMPKCEDHDVFHVLFECQPCVEEEVRLQMILWGNGRKTAYTLLSVAIGWVLYPEHHAVFKAGYALGKRCRSITRWNFQYLLAENTQELRQFIQGGPLYPANASNPDNAQNTVQTEVFGI
jgi:hypothetical protein